MPALDLFQTQRFAADKLMRSHPPDAAQPAVRGIVAQVREFVVGRVAWLLRSKPINQLVDLGD